MSEILGEERLAKTKEQMSLEEAAGKYEKKHTYQRYDGGGLTPEYDETLAEAFIAGAKWQKEQDTAPVDGNELLHVADKSYKIGWRDCKRQMLKDAEPAEIGYFNQRGLSILTEKAIERMPVSEGDKVKIIIVKEEEE